MPISQRANTAVTRSGPRKTPLKCTVELIVHLGGNKKPWY